MYTALLILSVTCVRWLSAENCSVPFLTGLVYQKIDSEPQNLTIEHSIELSDDSFHLLIANETLPELCRNSVNIQYELYVLQIRNVGLAHIRPGAFNITPTLGLLKISYNPLTALKKGVFQGLRVKEIDCSNNYISSIDEEAFDGIPMLEVLRLSYNAIKEVSPEWFKNSPNVYKLSIIFNELTSLPARAFQNMAKDRAVKLRLSANHIHEIDEDAFYSVGNIEVLRLNGNKLESLPENLFVNRTIRRLEINTNKLLCFPDQLFQSGVGSLAFLDNPTFKCPCLEKVRHFVETGNINIWYPAIICEDRAREVNIVFNYNKTYELPLILRPTEGTLG
nr:unnamed protein product [Callosobruchus analis]